MKKVKWETSTLPDNQKVVLLMNDGQVTTGKYTKEKNSVLVHQYTNKDTYPIAWRELPYRKFTPAKPRMKKNDKTKM